MGQRHSRGGAAMAALLFAMLSIALAGGEARASAQPPHRIPPAHSFRYNHLMTTPYGPAAADVVVAPSNMISCAPPTKTPLTYALCYYSGPTGPTGAAGNPALPCVLSPDGKSANCTCYKLTAAAYPGEAYQIDINGILNRDVYLKTVKVCGHDGAKCGANSTTVAPACKAVNLGVMMPRTKDVSVFSLINVSAYSSGKAPGSTACPSAKYAGCMTAPCHDLNRTDSTGKPLVSCQCPTFTGPYQVGQDGATCDANDVGSSAQTRRKGSQTYVWSASRVVKSSSGQ